jgi:integrase
MDPEPGSARLTPHGLRKSYATRYALGGVPQRVLQANLGHSPGSKVTDQYYVFADEQVRQSASLPLPVAPRLGEEVAISGNAARGTPGLASGSET